MDLFKVFFIFGPNAQDFAGRLLNGNHSSILDDLAFFYKFQSIFSKYFMNLHVIFKTPSLSKLFLSFFDQLVNLIIEFTGNFSAFIGYHKNLKFKIIFRKNSEILVKHVQFIESCGRKNGFFAQEKC